MDETTPAVAELTPEEIRGLLEGTTPGPWRWGGTTKHEIRLESRTSMIPQVMAFKRKGMNGAEPVFWDRSGTTNDGNPWANGVYCTATERAVKERDYRDDVVGIAVPDAALIAAAPDLARQLLAAMEENERLRFEVKVLTTTENGDVLFAEVKRDAATDRVATLEGIVRRLLDGYRPIDVDGDRVAWIHPSVIVGQVFCTEAEVLILKEMQQ